MQWIDSGDGVCSCNISCDKLIHISIPVSFYLCRASLITPPTSLTGEIPESYWQTRTHCRGNIVAHDVSLRAQTGKHLLRTQNVSEQNQKQFVSATSVASAGKRGNFCVGNNVTATMCPRFSGP